MADFLFEIGLEEVPARMIASAQAELLKRTIGLLERERLISGDVAAEAFSTPRRLAVLVRGVAERQEDLSEEVLGPSAKIAYKDGVAGPAAVAFAKKNGVEVSALKIVMTPKGEYIAATATKAGKSAADVIAAELPKELAGIYWAKNMYWRAGKPERFVRPVRWMVALLGDAVVPVEFGGYTAARETFGHRVLFGAEAIRVESPASYVEQLKAAFVMADVELRRHTIRKALDKVCLIVPEARWREDHALVDKMTHMTEWPSVIAGAFEQEYLALPEEVLVTVMRDHQNYFAVESKDGKLAPHFLAVLNTVADEAGEAVIRHGNERVLRARFNDARFFWEFDQRVSLEERVGLLENVTFQKDLGSYALKSVRVAEITATLADLAIGRGVAVDQPALVTACRLAKTDLTTELVKEFTELQGEVGGLYAQAQGFPQAVADAIYDQYRPTSVEASIPRTIEGQLLAIADKADTIAGMFSLGMVPTGSKDPFALRRAANGIVKILAEGHVHLTGREVVSHLGHNECEDKVWTFLMERIQFYLEDVRGFPYYVVKAVLSSTGHLNDDVRDAERRAEAIMKIEKSPAFNRVCLAFKRMKNILRQAEERGYPVAFAPLNLTEPAEVELLQKLQLNTGIIENLASGDDYLGALEEIANFAPLLDVFFEEVMVFTEDGGLRSSRLALLRKLQQEFTAIADFSEMIVSGGEPSRV